MMLCDDYDAVRTYTTVDKTATDDAKKNRSAIFFGVNVFWDADLRPIGRKNLLGR